VSRPTTLVIEPSALLHNLAQIRRFAPDTKIIAMVKANAYGCGVGEVAPLLDGQVDALGVACLEEALAIHAMGVRTQNILFQGVFSPDEYNIVAQHQFGCVIHQERQLQWLLSTPLPRPIKIWVKVNTGMHRLGFKIPELQGIMNALLTCSWVDKNIGLMSHLACADEPKRAENIKQMSLFQEIQIPGFSQRSIANSAAIISFPQFHADVVRPGIMLYGVSPFANQTATDLGLIPVMRFMSAISAIHFNPSSIQVGYGGTWSSDKPSVIGVVAAGYGDGYPRHISANTSVWVKGREVPIVGKVSMDMLTVDLTNHPDIQVGESVELWGAHILVEHIAKSAGTIGYELMCQISERVRHN
jgi:alanine racemase